MPAAKAEPGLLLVDKPVDETSHAVVQVARRALGERRIGHAGTLDPFATGLLLLAVGTFTRALEYFHVLRKTYVGTMRLGQETDTEDHTGSVIRETDAWQTLTVNQIEAAVRHRVGPAEQVPPAFSAKRVDGVRAYARARAGEPVVLDPVPIIVHDARVRAVRLPDVEFETTVSTGTYIRALARDVGRDLGSGAHLVGLRRTRIGPFEVDDAFAPGEIPGPGQAGAPGWLGASRALSWMNRRELSPDEVTDIEEGRSISSDDPAARTVALLRGDRLVAIGEVEGGLIRPRKVFPA
jgi:tRNA pseudouridine55 synthase